MKPVWPICCVLALVACGGSSNDGGSGTVVNCQNDPRVTAYAPNLTVKSSGGSISWTLVQSAPAPPARDNNTWTMHAADSGGQALANLSVTVQTLMPDHGHGSPVTPAVTNQGGGTYKVDPLYFFMPGVWRVRFLTTGSNETTDFWFCVPG